MAEEYLNDFIGKMQNRISSISNNTVNRVMTISNVLASKVSGYRGMHAHQVYKRKGLATEIEIVGETGGGRIVGP